ncbi:MAG: hypothetical protein IT285_09520 [Bdellovibrionales bacterium]|nr:hypothetical protein [Bdellovibrionales bacterium]
MEPKKRLALRALRETRIRLAEEGPGALTPDHRDSLREQLIATGEWELARSFDLEVARASGDSELWARVYFGTPGPTMRRRLILAAGAPVLPEYFDRLLRPEAGRASVSEEEGSLSRVSVADGSDGGGGPALLRPGLGPQRLLQCLASDFYAPFPPSRIQPVVFPGERYHRLYSADRVRHLVQRLRRILEDRGISLRVVAGFGGYRLAAGSRPCVLRIPRYCLDAPDLQAILPVQVLAGRYGSRRFTISEAALALRRPVRSVNRFLHRAAERGTLRRVGYGHETRFEVPG